MGMGMLGAGGRDSRLRAGGLFGLDHSERVPDLATPANLSHQTQPKESRDWRHAGRMKANTIS